MRLDPGGSCVSSTTQARRFFAQAGAVQAGKRGMDFLGCLIVGCITAMGGGTFRGFVLGERPVFWAAEPDYLYISLAAAGATFFFWPRFEAWWIMRGEEVKPNERARPRSDVTARDYVGVVVTLGGRDQHRGVLRDRREQRFAERER